MKVQIFDVEHGGCALVTANTGARMLIDAGHNGTTSWRPSTYLRDLGVTYLERLVITNCDEDHASDLANLRQAVTIANLYRTSSINGQNLTGLKGQDQIGPGIVALIHMMNTYVYPVTVHDFGPMTMQMFHNDYPTFEDENNLSLVCVLKCRGLTIAFPGDLEVAGWKALLQKAGFRQAMSEVNVLVASHHGRENGCCEELFSVAGCSPQIVIISDSGIQYATQDTVAWYRQKCSGMIYNGDRRHVFTTRRDGRILLEALPGQTTINTFK